jgi:clan AA aspartic protease (TIGR02281 family)
MRDYPPAFQDRFQLLAHSITEIKGEDGKIVIQFPPGSHRVTVTTSLNGTLNQEFLVDTGATNVTIPLSTAEALGLNLDGPQRRVATAGGFVNAREVMIDEIEINGWVEYDVRAYVLDVPDHSGVGLLGLNYLGRFQVDLKSDQGTLLLKPR